jgi:hypothetical protein
MRAAALRALVFAVIAAATLLTIGDSPIRDTQGNAVPIETLRGIVLLAVAGLVVAGLCFLGALGGFALLRTYSISMWRVVLIGAVHGLLMAVPFSVGRVSLGDIGGVAIVVASAGAVAFAGGRLMCKKAHV